MDPDDALVELMEMGAGLRGAALLDADGAVVASRGAPALAVEAAGLWLAADEAARRLGRPAVERFEIGVDGALVVGVRGAGGAAVAVADPDATVGLVAYDLRSALRGLGGDDDGEG